MTDRPDISVVMCTYNRADMLRRQLESLMDQKTSGEFSYEIVVVDDASTDDTPDVVKQFQGRAGPTVRYVRGEGRGVAPARNTAVAEASGEWIAFTDDDQVNEPDWLYILFDLARRTGADCVGGARDLRLEAEPDIPLTPQTRGILGAMHHDEAQVFVRDDMPSTGSVLVKQSIFDVVGPFDESLAWSGEDDLFARRILRAGLCVWFTPRSVVHHLIPPYRVTPAFFRWISLRVGVALAEVDHRMHGRGLVLLRAVARTAMVLAVHVPRLAWASLTGDRAGALDRKCAVWRAMTYTYETLYLFAPRLFPRGRVLDRLKLRAEREIPEASPK